MADTSSQTGEAPIESAAKVNPLLRVWQSRDKISTQLILFVAGASLLLLIMSAIALTFFGYQGEKLRQVSEQDVPRLIAAFELAQEGTALAAALPMLQATTEADFAEVVAEVEQTTARFDSRMSMLADLGRSEAATASIHVTGVSLKTSIRTMVDLVEQRFLLQAQIDQISQSQDQLQRSIRDRLGPMIDDQLFLAMTGLTNLGENRPPAPRADADEFETYRYLREISSSVESASELLSGAFTEQDIDRLIPRLEEFEANEARVERYSKLLQQSTDVIEVLQMTRELFALGLGDAGGFALRQELLRLLQSESDLIQASREIIDSLYSTNEGLVMSTSDDTNKTTEEVSFANTLAIALLVLLNVLSIYGGVILTRRYVLRRLINRIDVLADRMFTMADGNLNVNIPVEGTDEIAHMANALEVFRQNSLEALRLNEVERLNQQLTETNDRLEEINEELKTAQSQIVMREKLAAMGELTAGVAHEIKNPLNFVMNFADSSSDLLDELLEELELPEEKRDKEIVKELKEDLLSNLGRIQQHGERANSIVRDMLAMGRETSEWSTADINKILSEHANLAFHSARAANPEFQLSIVEELEADLPEIAAIPSDLARVFLNMFLNSCHAVEQRRKSVDDGYEPTLTIRTHRDNQHIMVEIEDNGTGIESDKIEKIFQPFFTTKPTDEGTGLGLALAADIVRAHGGLVEVESEVGQFTRMKLRLPMEQSDYADPQRSESGS